jgi:hypothetical protein
MSCQTFTILQIIFELHVVVCYQWWSMILDFIMFSYIYVNVKFNLN